VLRKKQYAYVVYDFGLCANSILNFKLPKKTSLPKKSDFSTFVALSSSRKEHFDEAEFITF